MLNESLAQLMALTPQQLSQFPLKDLQEEHAILTDYTEAYGPDGQANILLDNLEQAASLAQQ